MVHPPCDLAIILELPYPYAYRLELALQAFVGLSDDHVADPALPELSGEVRCPDVAVLDREVPGHRPQVEDVPRVLPLKIGTRVRRDERPGRVLLQPLGRLGHPLPAVVIGERLVVLGDHPVRPESAVDYK